MEKVMFETVIERLDRLEKMVAETNLAVLLLRNARSRYVLFLF